ncbi:hypothetical protein WDV94_02425 [Clavibacter tessellarius]
MPVKVVVATTFDLDEYVYGALRAGASGFLLKDAGAALLVEAVRAAHSGDQLISPSVTVRLLQHLAPRSAATLHPDLTAREPRGRGARRARPHERGGRRGDS